MEGAGEREVVALDPAAWGAGFPDSGYRFKDTLDRFTLFLICMNWLLEKGQLSFSPKRARVPRLGLSPSLFYSPGQMPHVPHCGRNPLLFDLSLSHYRLLRLCIRLHRERT